MDSKVYESKENFLVDMLEYYSYDPDARRNINENGCQYAPLDSNTEGCAIGRHLPLELARKFDHWHVSQKFQSAGIMDVPEEELPENLKFLGIHFLEQVQQLHDGNEFWSQKGLSASGKIMLEDIIKFSKLFRNPFEKFLI